MLVLQLQGHEKIFPKNYTTDYDCNTFSKANELHNSVFGRVFSSKISPYIYNSVFSEITKHLELDFFRTESFKIFFYFNSFANWKTLILQFALEAVSILLELTADVYTTKCKEVAGTRSQTQS